MADFDPRLKEFTAADDSRAPARAPAKTTAGNNYSSYQNYLFGRAGQDLYPAWSDSASGRAMIRVITRGIFGSLAFTIAGRYAQEQMLNYHPETYRFDRTKPLQALAKGIDTVLMRPIGGIAKMLTGTRGMSEAEALAAKEMAAWDATHFRSKSYFHTIDGLLHHGQAMNGRSIGGEVVPVTFDFAMASIGDATMRNVIQAIDPNIRHPWMRNDRGEIASRRDRKHFDAGEWFKAVGRATWRVLSKNQGEDWFAALPYVYQMKFQREFITHLMHDELHGAKLVFDNGLNGAAFKINARGDISGDYQFAGAMDLHARFVGYNVYTLIFREGYDRISNALHQWRDHGFSLQMPQHFNPVITPIELLGQATRYLAKSVIKANLYMQPSVVPFWMMRTPQTKWRGALIHQEVPDHVSAIAAEVPFATRVAGTLDAHVRHGAPPFSEPELREAMLVQRDGFKTIHNYMTTRDRILPHVRSTHPDTMHFGDQVHLPNPMANLNSPFDPKLFEKYDTSSGFQQVSKRFSQAVNPFGWLSYTLGNHAVRAADALPEGALKRFISRTQGTRSVRYTAQGRENFVRNFVDAATSYTPYMWLKAETALRVDDRRGDGSLGQMDQAIYRLIDNTVALRLPQAASAVRDIWNLALHFEKQPLSQEGGNASAARFHAPGTVVQSAQLQRAPGEARMTDLRMSEVKPALWADVVLRGPQGQQYPDISTTRH